MIVRTATLFLACVAFLGLAACAPRGAGPLDDPRTIRAKSLKSYNYDAVDALMDRAGSKVNRRTPMLVGTIGDVNNVETSSTLGRSITEQVSGRLAQKGYRVAELKLRQGISIQPGGMSPEHSGEYLLSRDARDVAGQHKAAVALAGTYSVGARNVLVNLRLIDIKTGHIITAYDYVLPKSMDVSAMTSDRSQGPSRFFGTRWDY